MLLLDLLFALFIALVLAALIAGPGGWRHPRRPDGWGAGMFLFLLLLPLIWAGGIWMSPMGPSVSGSYWLPPLVVGLIAGLLVLAIGSGDGRGTQEEDAGAGVGPDPSEAAAFGITAMFGLFFWLLLLAAVVAIGMFYAT